MITARCHDKEDSYKREQIYYLTTFYLAKFRQLSLRKRFAYFLPFRDFVSNAADGGARRYIMNEVITGR